MIFHVKHKLMEIFQVFLNNGIKLSEKEANLLMNYADLLKVHNQRLNLISRKDVDDVLIRHILPCYVFSNIVGSHSSVLDIGTGGGLPGIPYSIKYEKSQILLVDSTKKKIDAVSEIVQTLNLSNVETLWTRAESSSFRQSYKKSFDLIISRATSDLLALINYSIPLFKNLNRGKISAMKGGDLNNEIRKAQKMYPSLKFSTSPLIYIPGNENNLNKKYIVTVENFR